MLICSKDEFFAQFCIYLQICVLLLLFVFQKLEKIATKRDSATGVFLWILQSFANFITEHLRTATSEIFTESSLRNSVRNGKLHIISPFRSLTINYYFARFSTLKSDSHLPKFFLFALMIALQKMMKNAFYFTLKALFVLKILTFLSWLFGHVEKNAWLERQG